MIKTLIKHRNSNNSKTIKDNLLLNKICNNPKMFISISNNQTTIIKISITSHLLNSNLYNRRLLFKTLEVLKISIMNFKNSHLEEGQHQATCQTHKWDLEVLHHFKLITLINRTFNHL